MKIGRVFYSDGSGNARPNDPSIEPGWYYQIDLDTPVGPFESKKAAKATIRQKRPLSDRDLLLRIQAKLDGREWSCDTLDEIAQLMITSGYRIRAPQDEEES